MSSTQDHALVARVVSTQDTAAFGELVRRHQSQVRNFLRKLAGDISAADDLSQDCFMHAWEKMHTYSGRGSFIGWLLKVAYTTFLQSKTEVEALCGNHGGGRAQDGDECGDLHPAIR